MNTEPCVRYIIGVVPGSDAHKALLALQRRCEAYWSKQVNELDPEAKLKELQ